MEMSGRKSQHPVKIRRGDTSQCALLLEYIHFNQLYFNQLTFSVSLFQNLFFYGLENLPVINKATPYNFINMPGVFSNELASSECLQVNECKE